MGRPFLRHLSLTVSRYLFAGEREERHAASGWLLLRLLAIIYFLAFLSLHAQIIGLIGDDGILPAGEFLREAEKSYGLAAFFRFPTLFWYGTADWFLKLTCLLGCLFSLSLLFGLLPFASLLILFLLYLSLASVAPEFLSQPFDYLLLEVGFLAVLLASFRKRVPFRTTAEPPKWIRLLLWWLLFRLHFQWGIHQLFGDDNSWRALTALAVYFQNQPIPTRFAWYLHQFPLWMHQIFLFLTLVIKLVVPFFIFGPRKLRQITAFVLIGSQMLAFLFGNQGILTLLIIALCLFLLDDRFWGGLFSFAERGIQELQGNKRRGLSNVVNVPVSALILLFSGLQLLTTLSSDKEPPGFLRRFVSIVSPYRMVNRYTFPISTARSRNEIMVEGSANGEKWFPYDFAEKPGDPEELLGLSSLFHPRLDRRLWRAVNHGTQDLELAHSLSTKCLQGSPPVLRLLKENPFPKDPPQYIRARLYAYRFTDFSEKSTGWWNREFQKELFQATAD